MNSNNKPSAQVQAAHDENIEELDLDALSEVMGGAIRYNLGNVNLNNYRPVSLTNVSFAARLPGRLVMAEQVEWH